MPPTDAALHRLLLEIPDLEPVDLPVVLAQAARVLEQRLADRLALVAPTASLTARDLRVLLMLGPRGTQITELREREHLTRQGIHGLVDRLVEQGVAERDWHLSTMAQTVRLTESGLDVTQALRDAVVQWVDELGPVLRGGSSRGLLEDLQVLADDRPLHRRPTVPDRAVRAPGGPEGRLRPSVEASR